MTNTPSLSSSKRDDIFNPRNFNFDRALGDNPAIQLYMQQGQRRAYHTALIEESIVKQTIQSMDETGERGRVKSRIEQNQKDFGLTGQILSSLSQNLG